MGLKIQASSKQWSAEVCVTEGIEKRLESFGMQRILTQAGVPSSTMPNSPHKNIINAHVLCDISRTKHIPPLLSFVFSKLTNVWIESIFGARRTCFRQRIVFNGLTKSDERILDNYCFLRGDYREQEILNTIFGFEKTVSNSSCDCFQADRHINFSSCGWFHQFVA